MKQYLKLQLANVVLLKGQKVQISIYGSAESFTVLAYALKAPVPQDADQDKTPFFVSKETAIEIQGDGNGEGDKAGRGRRRALEEEAKAGTVVMAGRKSKYFDMLQEMLTICLESGPTLAVVGRPKVTLSYIECDSNRIAETW